MPMTNASTIAIVMLLAAIDLANENTIDPDAAVELLELSASQLQTGTSDERFYLSEAVDSIFNDDEELSPEEIKLCGHFMENFGLQ